MKQESRIPEFGQRSCEDRHRLISQSNLVAILVMRISKNHRVSYLCHRALSGGVTMNFPTSSSKLEDDHSTPICSALPNSCRADLFKPLSLKVIRRASATSYIYFTD